MAMTKEDLNRYQREWRNKRKDTPEWIAKQRDYNRRYKAKDKDRRLRQIYGVSLQQYERMHAEQDGRCAVCLRDVILHDKMTHLDHCHVTGKVRGILCHFCNTALGKFGDNTEILKRAIDYLEAHRG